ncbi:MAG: DUF6485 family protein [Clostridiales bacterium]|jgi:hypothetical protein|nr:DUF6485 family protein [Clostridiales bacterium]
MGEHFCACPARSREKNSRNHDCGCDLCIRKNLDHGEIPSCFFLKVSPDIDGLTEFTFASFADFYLKRAALCGAGRRRL